MKLTHLKNLIPTLILSSLVLTSCSEDTPSRGSSITTGSEANSNTSTGTTGTTPPSPELSIQNLDPTDPKEASFTLALSNLLLRFDTLNTQISQDYQLLQQYPESSKALNDFLTSIGYLRDLLQSTADLDPPDHYKDLTNHFTSASLQLSEAYKEVSGKMSSGYQATSSEQLNQLETFTADIITIADYFASSAFNLLSALGHVPLVN